MGRVRALPVIVRGEREDAQGASDPVIDHAGAKEGAVTAIMLDHEEPDQEPGRRESQGEGQPVAHMHECPHRRPNRGQWHESDADFHKLLAKLGSR